MIQVDVNEAEAVAIIRPEQMHGLSQDDIRQLTDRIDRYLQDHEGLRGLIIVTEHFPGWEDFKAFTSHMRFVRDHHKSVAKVALVSDSRLLSAAPHLVDHFVNAKIRHFPFAEVEQAKAWASSQEPRSGRFVVLEDYPDNVVAFRAEGEITREDYEETLIPLVKERIAAHGKVKLLYWCGPAFEGISAGAMWDDARFGLTHLGDFSKVAIVSDVSWIRQAAKLFAPLVRAPVQVFHDADIEDAKNWITAD